MIAAQFHCLMRKVTTPAFKDPVAMLMHHNVCNKGDMGLSVKQEGPFWVADLKRAGGSSPTR